MIAHFPTLCSENEQKVHFFLHFVKSVLQSDRLPLVKTKVKSALFKKLTNAKAK